MYKMALTISESTIESLNGEFTYHLLSLENKVFIEQQQIKLLEFSIEHPNKTHKIMHFPSLSAGAIILALSLQSIAAAPTPDSNRERRRWKVEIFTDDLCEHSTGQYSWDQPTKHDFDGLPPIMSLKATEWIALSCGYFSVSAKSDGKSWTALQNQCLRVHPKTMYNDLTEPLEGFEVFKHDC
ncbi:MAG: hypothetical protein L6R41_002490 [Letrouitia leprolyta]|nr:MAG: hypothetical protein L6R41_002490 [Letrouitia leprolyta]